MKSAGLRHVLLLQIPHFLVAGGALLEQVGTWSPGVFGAVIMIGVTVYVFTRILNHPIVINLREDSQHAAVSVSVSD